jgi:hypothetical protein
MNGKRPTLLVGIFCVAVALAVGACESPGTGTTPAPAAMSSGTSMKITAPEDNPIGDIPDTQVYVPYSAPGGSFSLTVPEGWAQTADGAAVSFTDKLNSVRIETRPAAAAPTADSVKRDEMANIPTGFTVEMVKRNAGEAVLATYQTASAPNPVTDKSGTDAVERYSFWRAGQEVILTLSGPVGADNVDPWRTITDSLKWR